MKMYVEALKKIVSLYFGVTRDTLKISQNKMAENLLISERSYVELEHGHNLCNSVSLLIYLIYYCSDVSAFLTDVKSAFENIQNHAA